MASGRQVIGQTGEPISVLANLNGTRWTPIGITIDWSTVTALASQTTYTNGDVYPAGKKVLRYGQVLCLITSVVNGSTVGMYGPYDPAATDGRQTLTPGSCFVLHHTLQEQSTFFGGTTYDSDHVGAFDGGLVFQARLIQSGVATHTLAAGPTLAEFKAAFPSIRYII